MECLFYWTLQNVRDEWEIFTPRDSSHLRARIHVKKVSKARNPIIFVLELHVQLHLKFEDSI